MYPRFFRELRHKASVASVPEIVSFGPVEPGRVYHVNRVTVENETSVGTGDIRLSVSGHGYDHFLRQYSAPVNDVLYTDDGPIHLFEGETLEGRFTGTTDGDSLQMYLEGFWHKLTEGETLVCRTCATIIVSAQRG